MKSKSRSIWNRHLAGGLLAATLFSFLAGCSEQPTMFQNPDPNLRLTKSEFRSDADARFPYKTDAPRENETKARAQVYYDINRVEIVNFTGQDWNNVEVWINREYVCHVPKMEDRQLKEVHFPMLYNAKGESFPMTNHNTFVRTVEVYREGKLYSLAVRVAD